MNADSSNLSLDKCYRNILVEKAQCVDELRKKRKIVEESANVVQDTRDTKKLKSEQKCKF